MTAEFATQIMMETLKVISLLCAPVLIFGLVAGLLVGIFQAVTQIHEMTLTFIPKMMAAGAAFLIFLPWMLRTYIDFATLIFTNIPIYLR
ncbi:MAG: EscS/YscS/HrcS family type III secretion system export apparatus protein [Deltaproteobacteria bacterium]|nr:MAG: EscS/YscS/HrcS family type III secretion system export apparatus protein [Deltaproteobacteria bacterium]RLA97009.1 MAG: EscS/YscS/HrcS family type III secretion system export apparatus protein [Deltaproteobacteria bacterium]